MKDPLKGIITSCLQPKPELRPSFEAIERKLMCYRTDYRKDKDSLSHYLCLNILRRSIVLLESFKNVKLVTQWYMALLIEHGLGIVHIDKTSNSSDFREKNFDDFLKWKLHNEECQQDIIKALRDAMKKQSSDNILT